MISTTNPPLDTCPHCGNAHSGQCPRVKAIEYYPDGKIKRVEYKEDAPVPYADWTYRPYPWYPYPFMPTYPTWTSTTSGNTSEFDFTVVQ